MLKLSFGNMTVELNIFNLQRQPALLDEIDSVNWLDVYACNDSCADSLVEDENYDEINSLPFLSSDPSFSGTYTADPTLELKLLPDSFKYVFLGPNDMFSVIIASDLTEDQEEKLLTVFRENKEAIG